MAMRALQFDPEASGWTESLDLEVPILLSPIPTPKSFSVSAEALLPTPRRPHSAAPREWSAGNRNPLPGSEPERYYSPIEN